MGIKTNIHQKTKLLASEKKEISFLILSSLHEKLLPVLGKKEKALSLLQQSYSQQNCFFVTTEKSIVAFLAFKTKKGGFINPSFSDFFTVYGVYGFIKAIVLGMINYHPQEKELYLEAIAVDKNLRGKGIGSQLIQHFFKYAEKNDYKTVSLEVVDTNTKAFSLYKNLGFYVEKKSSLGILKYIFHFPFQNVFLMKKKVK